MTSWHDVPVPLDAAEGTLHSADPGGVPVVLVRLAASWHALSGICTHEECPFAEEGELVDSATLVCNCHGAEFDVATGAVLEGPAVEDLRTFATRLQDGSLQVALPD
jgi:nitrite reductase/ring-hydroxylating ferredoxin subunit